MLWGRVLLICPDWSWTHSVAQTVSKLMNLGPHWLDLISWADRLTPPDLFVHFYHWHSFSHSLYIHVQNTFYAVVNYLMNKRGHCPKRTFDILVVTGGRWSWEQRVKTGSAYMISFLAIVCCILKSVIHELRSLPELNSALLKDLVCEEFGTLLRCHFSRLFFYGQEFVWLFAFLPCEGGPSFILLSLFFIFSLLYILVPSLSLYMTTCPILPLATGII